MKTEKVEGKSSKKRKLSRFLCQEMLYDYIMDNLDPDRREAVREYLTTDEQMREALENLREGLSLTHKLKDVSASVPVIEQLMHAETPREKLTQKLSIKRWPNSAKLAVEAFVVSGVVALVISVIPWEKLQKLTAGGDHQSIEIAKADHPKGEQTPPPPPAPEPQPAAQAKAKPIETPPPAAPVVVAKTESKTTKPTPQVEKDLDGDKDQLKSGKLKGFVYRAFMRIPSLDANTLKIADAIRSLGGEKAGEVELGWRRNASSYFHFSMPEKNYDQALRTLQTFGPVRIYKEPHRRVMPEGAIRIILWVEPAEE